jgi:hypothetical protein
MVICGGYMFEFTNSKDMEKGYNKGDGSRESSGTFMSNTNHQRIENYIKYDI